jgi:hypothetical protein
VGRGRFQAFADAFKSASRVVVVLYRPGGGRRNGRASLVLLAVNVGLLVYMFLNARRTQAVRRHPPDSSSANSAAGFVNA